MKYDDLEKTKDLFDIPDEEVPSPIDDIDSEGVSKEEMIDDFTFGLSGDDAVEPQREEVGEEKQEKPEKKKREETEEEFERKMECFI